MQSLSLLSKLEVKKRFGSFFSFLRGTKHFVCVLLIVVSIPHWWLYADVTDKYRKLAKQAGEVYGADAEKRIIAWRRLVSESRSLPITEQLTVVNNFFNQMDFVDDIDLWAKEDYWATPIEFLGMRDRKSVV